MKLYARDAKNKIRTWEILQYGTYGFTLTSGLLNGAVTDKTIRVEPKANRTQQQQIDLEMASRIKRKLDAGFVKDVDLAATVERTNSLGFKRPMLAKAKYENYDKLNSLVQIKYDGLRCLITNINGVKYAYSKSGILYPEISHILNDVEIPEGTTIDGELYCHGVSLQKINSWVKRGQEDTKRLIYHCYDEISPDCFSNRLARLRKYSFGDSIQVVPTWKISELNIVDKMMQVRSDGYEGLIVRQLGFGYQSGKRNNAMIKIKQFLSDEFKVIGILESKDGMARLVLQTYDGAVFNVFAPGTHDEKYEVLENSKKYIGKLVEVEYANLSDDGIPVQPVAKCFRDFE